MNEVNLQMKTLEGKAVNRIIDISNIQYQSEQCNVTATCPEIQRTMLLEWIEERGNQQHNTELTLVSWYLS